MHLHGIPRALLATATLSLCIVSLYNASLYNFALTGSRGGKLGV